MAGSPATGEDATDYFFRTPGELRKSGLFDEKDHCGSKLTSLIGRTAASNTAMGCKNHGYPSWNTYAASRTPASGRLFKVSK